MNPHSKALESMFDDMDDFETKKIIAPEQMSGKGFSVTISMTPDQTEGEEFPEGHDEAMCKGGCAMHMGGTVPKPELEADAFSGYDKGNDPHYKKGEMGMSDGGMIPEKVIDRGETDDLKMPPFLRKKKK